MTLPQRLTVVTNFLTGIVGTLTILAVIFGWRI